MQHFKLTETGSAFEDQATLVAILLDLGTLPSPHLLLQRLRACSQIHSGLHHGLSESANTIL